MSQGNVMLTLNQIRTRALAFAGEWRGETSESAEKQTFWNEFLDVFGIHRRRVASFEVPVSLKDGHHGKIDLFWRGTLLVEHKSAGGDLTAAFKQAADYFRGIKDEDLPKYVIVSDFARFRVYNLDDDKQVEFPLSKLHEHLSSFGFLTGHPYKLLEQAPQVNVKAAGYMAAMHDELRANGYGGHPLAVLLVRLMFCLFADHTGLWARGLFRQIIDTKTREDGRDVGAMLTQLFAVLDTPDDRRQRDLDEDLAALPYVNGQLFRERFDPPAFRTETRRQLLRCCAFDWSAVSPAIFGAMFQAVMDEDKGKRRSIGAHYTSERNILKALGPLLLDDLREAVRKATTEPALRKVRDRISRIAILDPACGCGNFLIVAYRELRQLEIEIHRKLQRLSRHGKGEFLSLAFTKGLNVDAMYGIEIEEFPVRVAETALYLIDHMMNMKASVEFGDNFIRLPLEKAPNVVCANALRSDWAKDALPAERLTCIVGNPPFIGKKVRTKSQVEDMDIVFGDWPSAGELDYVAAWYVKALRFVRGTDVPVAFVSTNSLTQGEQVPILWPRLLREGLRIRFAHRTFRWDNDAPGEASVYCVIIGWSLSEPGRRLLFDYHTPRSDPAVAEVRNINAYLIDFDDVFVSARRTPLSPAPKCTFGNMPNDDGNFLFTDQERLEFLKKEPAAEDLFRPFISAREFLRGQSRWCLWLKDVPPSVIRSMPAVKERIERVRRFRENSTRAATKRLAATPSLFGEIRQPDGGYIVVPRHSSESRSFVPIAMMPSSSIAADSCVAIHSNDLYAFGVLQSSMHMAWMRQVCGRIKSDYRYSIELVYNCFPWPEHQTEGREDAIRKAARALLDERGAIRGQSLADLYDADVMPPALAAAHRALDLAVDRSYRTQIFKAESQRVRFLFARYTELRSRGEFDALGTDGCGRRQERARRPRRSDG